MVTGTEIRVTTDTAGGPPKNQSYAVSISADGRFITYSSFASDPVAGDTNGTWDVFLYDAVLGTTTKISTGSGASYESQISADGNRIVFASDVTDLVSGDTNGATDIFVWGRPTNAITRVSVDEDGNQGDAASYGGVPPAISTDGRYVAFLSRATNLGGGPGGTGPGEPDGGDLDLFVKDLVTGEVRMVSVTPTGQSVNPGYFIAALAFTADGTKLVVDYSDSTGETAAPSDDNGSPDVIIVDLFAPDVPPPVVSIAIAPTFAEEGSAFTLTATRTGADLSQPSTVTYTITGDAANASDISTPLTGTITIPADETTATLTIDSVEDAVFEAFEEFTVVISNPVNATLGNADAGAAIIDDDAPLVSISDASIVEGDAGTTILEFTVTKSFATAGTSQVQVTVADVTATEGVDYELLTPVVTFDDTATTGVVQVRVLGDTLIEPDETFEVTITESTNSLGDLTIDDGTAIGTIINDDAASLSISDVSVTEGDAGTQIATFTITRTGDAVPVTVNFATEDVTATAGVDYFATSGIRVLGAGDDVFLATSWDGSDHYCGGQGSDTADYSQLEHGVKVYLWTKHGNSVGEVWGRESGHDRLKSVENIVGSQASDRIEGNRKANVIEGEAGNDWLSGGGGPDSFVFRPGFGNDKILDFDPYARGGQDHIVLADFGITEADFHDRVEIVDAGRHTVIKIDGDPDQTIRLVGVRDAHAIDMSDFAFAGGGLLET